MKQTKLQDGTRVHCIKAPEAQMLDHHVEGYLQHGISIEDNAVIFDVGANIGIFGVRATQKSKNVTIYCFEPIPDIAAVLSKNAADHGKGGMRVKQFGLSDVPDRVEFTYYPNTPALSTFKPEDWEHDKNAFLDAVRGTMKNPPAEMKWMKWIPGFMAPVIARHLVKGKKQVHCELRTLSSVIEEDKVQEINLLKVDCEGAELSVLKGIQPEHWGMIQSVVVEVHDVNDRLNIIRKMLTDNGFGTIHVEQEQGLESTRLFNIFAVRK